MTSLVSYNNNNLPDYCSICQEHFNNGCINNNKFITNPRKWNFEILYCGHVFCKNCFHNSKFPNNCPLCRKSTSIKELSFDSSCNKIWSSLSEYTDDFIQKGYMNRIIITSRKILKEKKRIENNGWVSLYAIIYNIAHNKINKIKNKQKILKEKENKKKRILNSKIKREYERLLKNYTRGWPKNKTLSQRENNKLFDKATQKFKN
jgi:hypothetical protein